MTVDKRPELVNFGFLVALAGQEKRQETTASRDRTGDNADRNWDYIRLKGIPQIHTGVEAPERGEQK